MNLTHPLVHVVALDGSGCDSGEVGGKGAGLDRLAAHGFPIPESYAVTATAYHATVAAAGLEAWLAKLANQPAPAPADLAAEVERIERTFRGLALGPELLMAIEGVAAELLQGGPVAVRSSATAEDLGVASFAGQYRTYTRLHDVDGVVDAVRRCWASLWLPAARQYRIRHHIAADGLAMATVIQSMVDADWSGVGFTNDPGSEHDVMRVEMVPGLGEPLVSGQVTPLDFWIRRDTLEITSADPAVSAPACVEDLARMMLQIETQFDAPQDVEWASVGDRLILLQARPITVMAPRALFDDGFDQPIESEDEFTPQGVVEMLPSTVPPLLWTINAPMIEHGYRSVVAGLGGDPGPTNRPFIGRFRGRAALNLSALRDVATSLPGGSATDVERQFLGRTMAREADHRSRNGIRSFWTVRKAQRRLGDEIDLVCSSAEGIVALQVDLATLPAWRVVGYHRAVRDLAWRAVAAEVAASSAATAAYRGLEMVLSRWLDEAEAATWAQRLTGGALGNHAAGARLDRELGAAYRRAITTDPSIGLAVRGEPSTVPGRLSGHGAVGAQLLADVAAAGRRAGSRSLYGGPTWNEEPSLIWQRLQAAAERPQTVPSRAAHEAALDELAAQLRLRRSWRMIRVLTGQVVDLRLRWVARQAGEAANMLRLRERAKTALLTLGGEERRLIDEIGSRLVASRQLRVHDDIQLLSDQELSGMLLGGPPPPEAETHWRRTVARRVLAESPLPETFTGAPDSATTALHQSGDVLHGWAASPGRVEAEARVIVDLANAGKLNAGDILVATATDSSWTSVIIDAGAIVLETGGPLAHAAIVAREFGIPAVLNVPGATQTIEEGESIEVDGYAGVIRRTGAGRGASA